jgi:DNA-binding NarL/FixJ family response regulator
VIRVLVVDDQEVVRAGLTAILDDHEDLQVVGTAADGEEAVRLVAEHAPDVVVMDLRMPVVDGVEATRRIVAAGWPSHVLVLTTFDADDDVVAALRAGASGFLLKDAPRQRLVDAIRGIAGGEVVLAPAVARRLVADFTERRRPRRTDARLDRLSPREREVLELAGRGLSNGEIAAKLWLGEPTVKTHLARALAKLGLRDRVAAVVFCHETGLVG